MSTATAGPARTIARNATALAASKVFTSSVLLLWQIVLGRVLGSFWYGVYGTIGALMAVGGALTDFGTGPIAVREMSRHRAEAGRYLRSTLMVQCGLGLLAYLVLQAGAVALGYDAALRAMLLFVGLNLIVDAIGTAGHNRLVADERMWWTGAIGAGHAVALVAFGSAALALGGGLWAVYVAAFAAGLARVLLYWWALARTDSAPRRSDRADRAVAMRIVSAGLPLGAAAILSLGFLHADKLVTTAVLGPEATGQLTAAFVIVFGLVEVLGSTTLVAALPQMSRDEHASDLSIRQPVLESLLFFNLLLGLPAAALIATLGARLVAFLFGDGFAATGSVLPVMGWCVLARMLEGAFAQALIVRDRQSQVLAARALGLGLNLAATLALLPRVGILGAAIGLLIGEVSIVAGMVRFLSAPRAWWERLGRRASRLLLPALALAVAVAAGGSRLPAGATAAIALFAYATAALVAGAVSRDQLRLMADALSDHRAP